MSSLPTAPGDLVLREGTCGCFTIGRSHKFQYGMLLYNIYASASNSKGSFLLPPLTPITNESTDKCDIASRDWTQEFRVETFNMKDIMKVTNRLTGGRVDSDYRTHFTEGKRLALMQKRKDIPTNILDAAMKESVERFVAEQGTALLRKTTLKPPTENKASEDKKKPAKKKGGKKKTAKKIIPKLLLRWLLNKTKVATLSNDNTRFPGLHSTATGWISGTLVKVVDDDQLPYHIKWDTEKPYVTGISEAEMQALYDTYVKCDDRVLLTHWLIGREYMWRSVKNRDTDSDLRCATVMYYDRLLEKYKLLYRDGQESFVSGDEIDACAENNKTYTLADKVTPYNAPWSAIALSKIESYGMYRARNVPPNLNILGATDEQVVNTTKEVDTHKVTLYSWHVTIANM
jgi:hypothetical protein